MSEIWFVFYSLCALLGLLALVERFIIGPHLIRSRYGEAWKTYQAGAFHPVETRPATPGQRRRVLRVAIEMASTGGRRAVRVEAPEWIAVHEVGSSGAFSGRGPYYIKRNPCVWMTTGRRHLVEVEEGDVQASNPQGGTIHERGVRVRAWDTSEYAPVSLREYAGTAAKVSRLLREAAAPLPPGVPLPRAKFERWAAWLSAPTSGRTLAVTIPATMLATGLGIAADVGGPIEWPVVLVASFLPGIAPGFLIGGALLPAVLRYLVTIVRPEAGRTRVLIKAVEKQGDAQRKLVALLEDEANPLAGHLISTAIRSDEELAAAVARPEPPPSSSNPIHPDWAAEALVERGIESVETLYPAWRLMTPEGAEALIQSLPSHELRVRARSAYDRAVSGRRSALLAAGSLEIPSKRCSPSRSVESTR